MVNIKGYLGVLELLLDVFNDGQTLVALKSTKEQLGSDFRRARNSTGNRNKLSNTISTHFSKSNKSAQAGQRLIAVPSPGIKVVNAHPELSQARVIAAVYIRFERQIDRIVFLDEILDGLFHIWLHPARLRSDQRKRWG